MKTLILILQNLITNNKTTSQVDFLITMYFPYAVLFFFLVIIGSSLFFLFFFRKHENLLLLLLYIELFMLLLGFLFATLFLISYSYYSGLVYSLTLLALSAAESVIGLSLLLVYFRSTKGSIKIDDVIKKD